MEKKFYEYDMSGACLYVFGMIEVDGNEVTINGDIIYIGNGIQISKKHKQKIEISDNGPLGSKFKEVSGNNFVEELLIAYYEEADKNKNTKEALSLLVESINK